MNQISFRKRTTPFSCILQQIAHRKKHLCPLCHSWASNVDSYRTNDGTLSALLLLTFDYARRAAHWTYS
jgi:hypothetical protein